MSERPSIAIVGAGRVGSALARVFYARGYHIAAIFSRTLAAARILADETNARVVDAATDAVKAANLIILAVPDDSLARVASELRGAHWADRAAVHTSGGHSINILKPLAEEGAMTGSLHPAYPFAHRGISADLLQGTTFAIESDNPRLTQWLYDFVDAAKGRTLYLRPDLKPLYHAALVMTSNYAVVLFAASQRILTGLGAGKEEADSALLALLSGTIDNLTRHSGPAALTGPLMRGDLEMVDAHLNALDQMPEVKAAYLALARLSIPVLAELGRDVTAVEALLNKWEGS